MARWLSSFIVVGMLAGVAAAEPSSTAAGPTSPTAQPGGPRGERAYVLTPPRSFTADATVSPFLFLNRCIGGCTVNGSTMNDARSMLSTIPCNGGASCNGGACSCSMSGSGTFTIHEFANAYGQIGANGTCPDGVTVCTKDADCGAGNICDSADYEWTALVKCVTEVYSPYAITITTTVPTGGVSYSEDIVAGTPADIGFGGQPILGVSPYPQQGDCIAHDNVISYTFANAHPPADRVLNMCWTVAQESAHAFGLDHEYQFESKTEFGSDSACNDPMTYRVDCGGEKFFRNMAAQCGEYATRDCKCGGAQNSHQKLINVFGAGTSTIAPPTAAIVTPAPGTVTNGFTVQAQAGSQRGVSDVELWLNGYKWASVGGTVFGPNGQPDPGSYALTAPGNVPDGVIDIVVKGFDDIGTEGDSPTVTVTKGAPCADATSCLAGQKCDAGKCYWDPPSGMLGDTCTYPQFCTSALCEGTADHQICTQSCIVGAMGSCPSGFDCIQTSGTDGICFPPSNGGGCCSVDHDPGALWVHGGLAALVLGFVFRRRRR